MKTSKGSVLRTVYEAKFGSCYKQDPRTQDNDHEKLKVRHRCFIEDYSPVDCDSIVFLDGNDFKGIFGDRHADTNYKNKLAIVKITNPQNGKSIHRQLRTSSELHRNGWKNHAVLTYFSLINLVNSQSQLENMDKVEISKGSIYKYYWNHPYHATKVATRIGIYSVVIGIISLILSLICIIH